MTKPRIVFLAPVADFKGGAERSLLDLMANPAISPHLVVPREGALSGWAGERGISWDVIDFGLVSTIRRPFRVTDGLRAGRDLLAAARGLNAVVRRAGAEVVHSNGLKAHAIALAARRLGGAPTVIHIRDIAASRVEKGTWRALQMVSDQTILISRACWPTSARPSNVRIVYNAFEPPGEIAPPLPDGGDLVVGFAGRIHPHKGLHVLIDAVAMARGRGVPVRLLVRGAFAPETPGYEREIAARIRRLGMADHVILAGYVSDAARVYEGMQVVCMPSIMPEPFGRAALEAMGRALPVIAAPNGGVPEFIADGETGLLAATAGEIADAIGRLARDPGLRAEIGRRARAHCLANFSLGRLHRDLQGVYESVRGGTATAAPKMAHG